MSRFQQHQLVEMSPQQQQQEQERQHLFSNWFVELFLSLTSQDMIIILLSFIIAWLVVRWFRSWYDLPKQHQPPTPTQPPNNFYKLYPYQHILARDERVIRIKTDFDPVLTPAITESLRYSKNHVGNEDSLLAHAITESLRDTGNWTPERGCKSTIHEAQRQVLTACREGKIHENSHLVRRLHGELRYIEANPEPTLFNITPLEFKLPGLLFWSGIIRGPVDTAWEGAILPVVIIFGPNYPFTAPLISFIVNKEPIFHPNIHPTGKVCLDILADQFNPLLSAYTLTLSVQSLLSSPNVEHAANAGAAEMLRANGKDDYELKVKQHVEHIWIKQDSEEYFKNEALRVILVEGYL
jgi:ubiquitin-protein ligase